MAEPNTVSMRRGKERRLSIKSHHIKADQHLQRNKERGETVIITSEEEKERTGHPPLKPSFISNVGLR